MVIEWRVFLKGVIKMNQNEVRKSIKIPKELDKLLKEYAKITGVTETTVIKLAIYDKVRSK